MSKIQQQHGWEFVSYVSVLLVAYFDMLLCWDLMKNDSQLFGEIFSTAWGLGIVTTVFIVHILIQMTFKQMIPRFSALLVSLLSLPLIDLCFSYVYSAYGVCDASSNPEQCLYHSVSALSIIGHDRYEPVGELAMYFSWQSLLGLILIPVLISQFVSLTSQYRHLQQAIR